MKTLETEDLQKHTLHLYSGDYKRLGDLYPDLSTAVVIRRLVRSYIQSIEGGKSDIPNVQVEL